MGACRLCLSCLLFHVYALGIDILGRRQVFKCVPFLDMALNDSEFRRPTAPEAIEALPEEVVKAQGTSPEFG